MLVKSGEVCHHVFFIVKGALRGYMKEEDRDITTWISIDNEVVTSISGLNDQAPSIENIQAIEHSDLVVISHTDLETLYNDYPDFNIVGRKLLQRYYQDAERRAFIARIPGTENRYQYFVRSRFSKNIDLASGLSGQAGFHPPGMPSHNLDRRERKRESLRQSV